MKTMVMTLARRTALIAAVLFAVGLLGASHARAESPYISEVTVETSSNEPGELSIYTFTLTFSAALDASEDGGSLGWSIWGQCREEENFESCNPDFSDAAVVSNDLGDLEFTLNEGQETSNGVWFDLYGANITPGTYTITMNGIVNGPEVGTYTVSVFASLPDQEPTDDSGAMATFLLGTPVVQGTIYRADGTTPVGCGESGNCPWVSLHDEFWTVESGSTPDADGNFSIFDMDPGTYQLSVFINSPIDGEIAPDPSNVTVVAGQTASQNLTLVAATKTLEGSVLDTNGNPVDDAQVWASNRMTGGWMNANTDADGNYTMSLAGGTYEIGINPQWNENGQVTVDWMNRDDRPREVTFQQDNSAETFTENFSVVRTTSTVSGRVLLPDGTPYGRDVWVRLSGREGQGNGSNTDEESEFSIPTTAGTYHLEVNVWGSQYYGPEMTVTVGDGESVALGDITLNEMTARVIGVVEDQDGNPLESLSVNSWGPTGFAETQTESDGTFSMYVPSGSGRELMVEDRANRTYVYNGQPIQYTATNNTTTDVGTIELQATNARVYCTAVDTDGNRLDSLYGWLGFFVTDGPPVSGGQISRGTCGTQGIPVVAGRYEAEVHSDARDYSLLERPSFTITEGESVDLELVFAENDAMITGRIVDEDGNVITDVEAFVFADNHEDGVFYEGEVDPSTGEYEISLLGGKTLTLGMFIPDFLENEDPDAPRFLNGPAVGDPITIQSNETVERDLVVRTADASLVGTVQDPDGNTVSHGFVWCSSITPEEFLNEGFMEGEIFSGDEVNSAGSFDVPLISDITWNCGTGRPPGTDWLSADMFEFTPAVDESVEHTFQFEDAAGTISGSVAFADGTAADRAWVVAFTADGKFTETEVIDGAYTLPVTGDTTWTVLAETDVEREFYRSSEVEVAVGPAPDETVDLVLVPFSDVPPAYSTSFDVTQPLSLSLEDGFSLSLDANAVGSEGTATITLSPTTGLARTSTTKPVAYGYDISVVLNGTEVTELSSPAQLSIPYDEELLERQGLAEDDLNAMFFDESLGSWNGVSSVQLNTEANVITLTVSHFSTFSAISNGGATTTAVGTDTSAENALYITGRTTAGPNVRVVDMNGEQLATFNAYAPTLRGTWRTAGGDIDGDGARDIITTAGTGHGAHVRAFTADGTLIADYFAYDAAFRGGVNAVVGDVNGDGRDDVVTAPETGAANIQVYTYDTDEEDFTRLVWRVVSTTAYTSGLTLALADVDGDLSAEIITAGRGALNAYRYDAEDEALDALDATYPYGEAFSGNMNVASGDVDGDGNDEVVTAPSYGASNIRVFDVADDEFSTLDWFFAYDANYRGGTELAVADLDGVNGAEIVTAPSAGAPNVRAYTYTADGVELLDWGFSHGQTFTGGVNIVATDMDGDAKAELAVAPRTGAPNVRVYEWESDSRTLVDWFWGLAQTFTGGVNLGY